MPRQKRQPTLKSIAERCGVTANTVSLALRDSPLVVETTKARIRQAAREMGYVPNVLAGSLRSGRSNTVAILVGDVSNLLFAQRIKDLERKLRMLNYQVLILNTDEDPETEMQAIRTAVSHQVDGIILCPCQRDRRNIEMLRDFRTPYVLLGREFEDLTDDTVVWDDEEGARLAALHLIHAGCRSIVFLNGPEYVSSAKLRRRGYESVMKEAGLTPITITASSITGRLGSSLQSIIDGHIPCDGLFVFNDLMALEACSWLIKHGVRIPDDIAVVGFDDILSSVSLPFELTSIACDRHEEASHTVNTLLNRIKDPDLPPQIERLPVQLITRASSLRSACNHACCVLSPDADVISE